ncbi:MAG: hypothetical protein JO261_03230 [Alphaproteobacteria bacterium]|nr:hypothetical protein [Alphaproteobacteria bacterium]MBV9692693.1 hypothetical protein [Alphaproteobacteria bacterium]
MKRILFAAKDDWIGPVRERLDASRYEPVFGDFRDADFEAFDAVVPLRLSDYEPMWLRPCGRFLIPERAAVRVMHDKIRFNAFLASHGFGALVPQVYGAEVEYPFIYKKRRDLAGINSKVIVDGAARRAFEATVETGDYFKQHYVGGRLEYTTHLLCKDGQVLFDRTVEFRFDRDYFVRGVNFAANSIVSRPTPFAQVFAAIVEKLRYTGTCCFNFKIEGGMPRLFEVNPRAGGSLRLDLNAYLDAYLSPLGG